MVEAVVEQIDLNEEVSDPSLPPHSRDAEQWVIGSVLKSQTALGAAHWLSPDDFYDRRYRAIWRAMLDLWERAVPIDYATVADRLGDPDVASIHVGLSDLAEIDMSIPSAAHVEHYARIVANAATLRRYISAAAKISEAAWKPGADSAAVVVECESILATARPSMTRQDLLSPEQWSQAFIDDLTMRIEGQRTAVTTGLLDVDDMTFGLEDGRLYLLMGTTGTGKSELALQVAIHVAMQHGPVLFASLEMSAVELAQRYARITRGLDRNRLTNGTDLSEAEWALVRETLNEMHEGRLWPATPRGSYTTANLRGDLLEVRATQGKPSLVVADYLQLFRDSAGKYANREQNVGLIAENLKRLAREFACPVLAPVQPNRDHKNRPSDPRPKLTDLRDSGQLENTADVVLGLYRDELHTRESRDVGLMEIHMLKNRSGAGDLPGRRRRIVWNSHRYDNYAAQATGPLP